MKTLKREKVRPFVLENANVYVLDSAPTGYVVASETSLGECCGPERCCGSVHSDSEQTSNCGNNESSEVMNDSRQCCDTSSSSRLKQQTGCCG